MNLEEMAMQIIDRQFPGHERDRDNPNPYIAMEYELILEALRQVEAETRKEKLAAILPSEEEVMAAVPGWAKRKNRDMRTRRMINRKMQWTLKFYDWLRSKIQTVGPLSDEELETAAGGFFQETIDDLNTDRWSFKKGYRACEARLLGDSTTSQLLASTSTSNSDEKKGERDGLKKEEEKK